MHRDSDVICVDDYHKLGQTQVSIQSPIDNGELGSLARENVSTVLPYARANKICQGKIARPARGFKMSPVIVRDCQLLSMHG
jgi:hypothetical protein